MGFPLRNTTREPCSSSRSSARADAARTRPSMRSLPSAQSTTMGRPPALLFASAICCSSAMPFSLQPRMSVWPDSTTCRRRRAACKSASLRLCAYAQGISGRDLESQSPLQPSSDRTCVTHRHRAILFTRIGDPKWLEEEEPRESLRRERDHDNSKKGVEMTRESLQSQLEGNQTGGGGRTEDAAGL